MRIFIAALAVSLGSAVAPTGSSAQSEEAFVVSSISRQAELMKMAYDAARLANTIEYNQARTILAEIGGYTRYGYSERVTENNWLKSQIEELQLELPRLKRASSRIETSDEERRQIEAMHEGLAELIIASQRVHSAVAEDDLEKANRIYVDLTDPAYNTVIRATYTLVSEASRAIALERLGSQ